MHTLLPLLLPLLLLLLLLLLLTNAHKHFSPARCLHSHQQSKYCLSDIKTCIYVLEQCLAYFNPAAVLTSC
jgi:hypothetical protein